MLIDLGRNDAGRVSKIGSIKLTDLSFALQTMIHKIHSDSLMTMEEYND